MKKSLKKYLLPGEHNDYSPHLLKPKVVASFSLSLIVLKIILGFTLTFMPFLAFADTGITTEDLLNCTNENRTNKSLNTVVLNPLLSKAAAEKLEDMDTYDYWAHVNPETGTEPWLYFDNNKYDFVSAGENLAFEFKTSEGVCKGWMDSPTHRANMLDPTYQEIGFAVKDVDLGAEGKGVLIVQMFGSRMDFRENPPSNEAEIYSENPADETFECQLTVRDGPQITSPECGYIKENNPEIKAVTVEGHELNFRINEEDYDGQIIKEGVNRIIRLPAGYTLPEGKNIIEAYLIEQNSLPAITTINVDTSAPAIEKDSIGINHELKEGSHIFDLEVVVNDKNLEKVFITYTDENNEYARKPMELAGKNLYKAQITYAKTSATSFPVTINADDKAKNSSTLSVDLLTEGGNVKGTYTGGSTSDKSGTSTVDLETGWRYMVSGFLGVLFLVALISSILYKWKHENEDYLHITAQTVIIGILLISSVYFLI